MALLLIETTASFGIAMERAFGLTRSDRLDSSRPGVTSAAVLLPVVGRRPSSSRRRYQFAEADQPLFEFIGCTENDALNRQVDKFPLLP